MEIRLHCLMTKGIFYPNAPKLSECKQETQKLFHNQASVETLFIIHGKHWRHEQIQDWQKLSNKQTYNNKEQNTL